MRSESRGFTLIELMVVMAILLIGTSVGMASFMKYGKSQDLTQASADVASWLNNAKTNAVVQSFPPPCIQLLTMYSIKTNSASNTYEMWVYCNGTSFLLKNQKLPSGVTFDVGTSAEITFAAASGVSSGGTIKVKNVSKTNTIIIDTVGNITL